MRKRRLDLGLLQKDVAKILEVSEASVFYWETHRTSPSIEFIPRIIDFIGCTPYASISEMSLGEKIRTSRKIRGISQKELARQLGFDPGTIAQWECNSRKPAGAYLATLNAFLDPIISDVSESAGQPEQMLDASSSYRIPRAADS